MDIHNSTIIMFESFQFMLFHVIIVCALLLSEPFSTNFARIRFFTSMNGDVVFQKVGSGEALATMLANVRLVVCMNT